MPPVALQPNPLSAGPAGQRPGAQNPAGAAAAHPLAGSTATVRSIRKFPSADPRRMGKEDMEVWYSFADGLLYRIAVPAEGFSEATLTAAIREHAALTAAYVGRPITL
jgi:hypothetical protein